MRPLPFKLLMAAVLLIAPACVFAQYGKLYDFSQQSGREPYGSLIADGTLPVVYGMTFEGGANDNGTLFRYNLESNTYTKLVEFDTPVGIKPRGSLLKAGSTLFGMTSDAGPGGAGTIFKVLTDGSGFTTLFDFPLTSDGDTPFGSLILSGNTLYGMAYDAGANGVGTIFSIDTNGTGFTLLHTFDGDDGSGPYGELTLDGNNLYGMTKYGGTGNFGVIFKLQTNGSGYDKLMEFDWTTTGGYPNGSLTLHEGFLYGMTSAGGDHMDGTIFKISTSGSGFSKLLDFQGSVNAETPWGNLVFYNGLFYGLADGNGILHNGSVFTIAPDGSNYTTLFAFTDPLNGSEPRGSLLVEPVFEGVNLYGMMQTGGVNDYGVIFRYVDLWEAVEPGTHPEEITIYPVPANGFLNIRSLHPVRSVALVDITGNRISSTTFDSKEVRISLSGLPRGIYCAKIETETGVTVRKVVVR